MVKSFVSLVSILVLMVFSMGIHILTYPYEQEIGTLQNVTKLTNYAEISLSLAYDGTTHNATYPEMPALGRMDFVYEH